MIKNFTDKNNKVFDIILRGHYSHIKSAKKLKESLDKVCSVEGIRLAYPNMKMDSVEKLNQAYLKKSYIEIMSLFGMTTQTYYKGIKK